MTTNAMIAQVESLPELIQTEFEGLDERARTILSHEEWLSVKRVVATGCGDSHMAAVATQWAFERLGGVPTDAATAMRAARYALPEATDRVWRNPLTIGISVSGAVSRTREAVAAGKERGFLTIAVTGNPEAPLGQTAERILNCRIPDFVHAPGVRSYRISLLALWLMAIRLGEVGGRLTGKEAQQHRDDLRATADRIAETIELNTGPARELAEQMAERKHFTFVGDGPGYATALFSAAKILEAVGRDAWGQDTEEWAHLQYFSRVEPDAPTFVIADGGRGTTRTAEILPPMQRIGREMVLIAPDANGLAAQFQHHLPVAAGVSPLFSPMVNAVPGELFAAQLADVTGERYFGGFTGVYDPATTGGNNIVTSNVEAVADMVP